MGCTECSCKIYPALKGEAIKRKIDNLHNFSGLMVIGEAVTAAEAMQGTSMTGNGANVLKESLMKVGLPYKEDEVYYTVALKCAVPKKKGQKIAADAPVECRQFLLNEVAAVKPQLILVCGSTALQTLTGETKLKVTELYGRVMEKTIMEAKVLPIMNPGVLLHKPGDYKPFLSYLKLAANVFSPNTQEVEVLPVQETLYEVLTTREETYALWKKMISLQEEKKLSYVAFDIETTGLDYRTAEFLVLGICFEKGHAYVIPRELKEFIHNFIDSVPWICIWQGGKYDKKVLWKRNLGNVDLTADTIYMHYILDETSAHDLGYLSKVYLNAPEYKYKMNQQWNSVTLESYNTYFDALCERVSVDVDYTRQLYEIFMDMHNKPENQRLKNLYDTLIMPAASFLSRVEQNGILVNGKYLGELDVKYRELLKQKKEEIEELATFFWDRQEYLLQTGAKSAPVIFNPGSSEQMSWLVFDKLKLKPRIKKGRSSAKEILGSIENPPTIIQKVLSYRTVTKEHSTYVLGILNARDEDKRVRTNFTLHVTATGRLSSKEPNMQNQPSANGLGNVRRAFIAPPGRILAEIDYSGAELRWLAFLSKCPVLSNVFIEDRNLHVETAKALFGAHFSKQEKMRAKAVNFGIPYGREARSIAEEFNISLAEASRMIEEWLNTYYGARDYLNWCAKQVEMGNSLETPWGRKRRFGLVTKTSLHGLQNEAKNFPIQSASSDLVLYCALEIEKKLAEMDIKIINLIHDSILFEMPANENIIQEAAFYVNKIMIEAPTKLFNCPIPFKTDFEIGLNWGDIGGVCFDYQTTEVSKVMRIEKKDDSIETMSFDKWYSLAQKQEALYR